MTKSQVLQGNDLMLFKKEGEKYVGLGAATNHTMNLTAEVLETSSKDDGKWKTKIPGKLDWNMSTDNLYVEEDYRELLESWIKRTPIGVAFGLVSNANSDEGKPEAGWELDTTKQYTGMAYITSLTVNSPDNGAANYSATFDGTGPLVPYTATK